MTCIQVQNCRKNISYVPKMNILHTSILCLILLMYVATMHHLNWNRQESKQTNKNAVYDSDKPVTLKLGPWYELVDPKNLKGLPKTVSAKKPTLEFLSNKKEYVQKWKSGLFISYLTCITILQSFNLMMDKNIKFSVKTVWYCCDLEICKGSLKVGWTDKAAKFDIYHTYCVWEKPHVFNKPSHLTDQNHVNCLPWIYIKVTQIILSMTFLMYVAT